MVGDLRVTVLSVQDPFPASAVQPAPGNRLVSIRYEVVSESPVTLSVADLPVVELRDSTGVGARSEHGRLSLINGARTPGDLSAGRRMESSALFEVPGSAAGLHLAFRPVAGEGAVVVALD